MIFNITDVIGGNRGYQRTHGVCPVCGSLQWHVFRADDKSYQLKCFNLSCGHTESLAAQPGGPKERGGVNHTLERKMGLFDLPPFPPYESEYLSYSVMDTRRISPVGKEWK